MKTRPITAWLIMWEWSGDHAAVKQPYVDILSVRKNIPYIQDYVQRLHDLHCLTMQERASQARYNKPPKPPYEATAHRTVHGPEVHCGHNPHLVARQVRNLTVETDSDTGAETIRWECYQPKE